MTHKLGGLLVLAVATTAFLPAASAADRSGAFRAAQYPVEGRATLSVASDAARVELSDDFETRSGPDLFVLLHRAKKPTSYDAKDYVSLGVLKTIKGKQVYAVPAKVDLKRYRSVVIWCKKFDVTFAYAPLGDS
ncbi:MAG: DM13 domain-containing protein [Myxococcota bacterium]